MNYTTLLLDLDNTILDFDKAEAVAIRKVLKNNNLPFDDKAVKIYSDINKTFWERFERGEIPKSAIFEGRFEVLLDTFKVDGDPKKMSVEYCKRLSEGYFTIDGAISVLEYLKNKGYKLYATTNGLSSTQYKRIRESGIEPFFDKVFVSEDAGHQKPEKEYFDYVIQNIEEKDRSKMLVVGDSQSSDILGGINAEIDTCWYNPKGIKPKYKSKFEINNILDLENIL